MAREKGMGILLSTHLLDDVERLCDFTGIIHKCRTVLEGSSNELLNASGSRRKFCLSLKDIPNAFGELESVNIIKDKYSGQSKGFGFVEMPDNAEADKAIKALNGSELKGRAIKVNQAKPRGERSARRPRY